MGSEMCIRDRILGDSMDTKIYHDGNNTKIDHSGPGSLGFRSNNGINFSCSTSAGETAMQIIKDGGIKLYHNKTGTTSSILRFETTSQGVNVTGHSELDNVNIAGIVTATEYRGGGSTGIKVTSAGKVLIGTSTQGSTSADELTIENTGPMGISPVSYTHLTLPTKRIV